MFNIFLNLLRFALPKRRKQFAWMLFLVFSSAVVELFALGALALFIAGLSTPEVITSSKYALIIKSYLPVLNSKPNLLFLLFGMLVTFLLVFKNIMAALTYYVSVRFDGAVNVDLGNKILRGILTLPFSDTMNENSADMLRLMNWRAFAGMLFSTITSILCDVMISVMLLVTLFIYQPQITFFVIITFGLISASLYRFFRGRISSLSRQVVAVDSEVNRLLMQTIQGLKDIKLFNLSKPSVDRFVTLQANSSRLLATQRVYERASGWLLESFGMSGIVVGAMLIVYYSNISSAKLMTSFSLVAVSAWRILPAIYRSVGSMGMIRGYLPYLRRLADFITFSQHDERKRNNIGVFEMPVLSSEIRFKQVNYVYPGADTPSLSQVDLLFVKGSVVGVIGHSGAGKSTLAALIIGLLKPTDGVILIDGQPLNESNADSWRNQVGFVPQNPYLFDGTLAENIAFTVGDQYICIKKLAECVAMAGLSEFVETLPNGMNTNIGERGSLLSGGQAQRVSIARALYRDPQVLIFDEATSCLDNKTEEVIKDTILSFSRSKTIILIAHRFQTMEACSHWIWLEKGRVVEVSDSRAVLERYMAS